MAKAFKKDTKNPFWRVRAEFFEDLPKLLADTFSPPTAHMMAQLEEMKPCFLEGPRGTGKSMLLLSLRARNLASRRQPAKSIGQMFGFYLKLTPGAICNTGISALPDSDPRSLDGSDLVQVTETFAETVASLVRIPEVCGGDWPIFLADTERWEERPWWAPEITLPMRPKGFRG